MAEGVKTQNSGLRKIVKGPIRRTIEVVGEKAPWITADRLTVFSTAGVLATNVVVAKNPKLKKGPTAAHVGFSIGDSFDGEWSNWEVEVKGKKPSSHGPLLDAIGDKLQEGTTFVAQSIRARKNGRKATAAAYLLAAATSPLPALARARAESRGHVVRESGLGTRPVRETMGAAGIAFSDSRVAPPVLATFTAAQNIVTAFRRYQAGNDVHSPHCIGTIDDPAALEAAGRKYRGLQMAAAGIGLMTGAAALNQARRSGGP